jgi:hypothetical protein
MLDIKPIARRPYGLGDYLESDRDFVNNNFEACVEWLESQTRDPSPAFTIRDADPEPSDPRVAGPQQGPFT